jgi:hypothetical protein
MLPEVVINLESESKLVHVESKASILIANENRDVVQAKVGLLLIHVWLLADLMIRIRAEA